MPTQRRLAVLPASLNDDEVERAALKRAIRWGRSPKLISYVRHETQDGWQFIVAAVEVEVSGSEHVASASGSVADAWMPRARDDVFSQAEAAGGY